MEFQEILQNYKEVIDSRLKTIFDEKIDDSQGFIKTSYSYLKKFVLGGGKRLRSLFTIMAFKAVSDEDENRIYLPAVGIELFHNSSLIHDDIMDEDSERRGMLSMHKNFENLFLEEHEEISYEGSIFNKLSKRFGVSMAILQGNILYALTEKCIANSPFNSEKASKALHIINRAYRVINEGQMMDILSESKKDMHEEAYLRMIETKTAHLFKAAVQVGAVLGEADENQFHDLSEYAIHIGTGFQLYDDLIDIRPGQKGHALGSDIKKGKSVLLITEAFEKANERQKEVLSKAWGNEGTDEGAIQAAIDVLHATGAVEYVKQLIKDKIHVGKSILEKANLNGEAKAFFVSFADFLTDREL